MRPIELLLSVAFGAGILAPVGLSAEEPPDPLSPIVVGSRVRLRAGTITRGRVTGMVAAMDAASLTVAQDDGAPLRVPRDAVTELEVSLGRRRQALQGLLRGAVIGAAAGFALSPSDSCSNAIAICWTTRPEGAGLLALEGATLGVIIGALVKSDKWSRVGPQRVQVSVAPVAGRPMGIRLVVRF